MLPESVIAIGISTFALLATLYQVYETRKSKRYTLKLLSFYAPQQPLLNQTKSGVLTIVVANTGERPVFIDAVNLHFADGGMINNVPLGSNYPIPARIEPGATIHHIWSPNGRARQELDHVKEGTYAWLQIRTQSGQIINSQRFPVIHETTPGSVQ